MACSFCLASAALCDGLPVDLGDHVEATQATFGGRAARVHLGDDGARGAARQFQPARDVGRDVLEADAEAGRLLDGAFFFGRTGFGVQVEFADGDVDRRALAVAHDLDGHGRARLGPRHHVDELVAVLHGLAVELDDDVEGLDAGPGGGAARGDGRDEGARSAGQAEVLEGIGTHRGDRGRRSCRA